MAINGCSFGAAFNFVISLSVCWGEVKLNGGGLRYCGCKRLQKMNFELINTLIGFAVGGGLVGVFTIPSAIKKAKAEAKEPEIEAWRKLVDELQEQNKDLRERIVSNERRIDELNSRIDDLYKTNGEWREENNVLKAENSRLMAENEQLKKKVEKLGGSR